MNFLTVLQLSKCGIELIEKLARIEMPRLTSLSLSFFFAILDDNRITKIFTLRKCTQT
jgi:hypothetical protein